MTSYLQLINIDKIDKQSIVSAPDQLFLQEESIQIGRSRYARCQEGMQEYSISLKKFGREVISRIHAELKRLPDGRYEIFDMGAMNGLFVNRVSLRGRSEILSDGDIVQFGGMLKASENEEILSCGASIQYEYRSAYNASNGAKRKHKAIVDENGTSHVHNDGIEALNRPAVLDSCAECVTSKRHIIMLDEKISDATRNVEILEESLRGKASFIDQLREEHGNEINGLNSELSNLRNSVESSQQQLKTAQDKMQELQQEIKRLQETVNIQQEQNQQMASEINRQSEQLQKATALAVNSSSFSAVDDSIWTVCGDSLQSCLRCALCSEIVIDVGVLPCSHGFCRSCLESCYHGISAARESTSIDLRLKKNRGFCPVCNRITGDPGKGCGYVRSAQLDNIVWLLVECSDEARKQAFQERESQYRARLAACGIDPDDAPDHGAELESSSDGDGDSEY